MKFFFWVFLPPRPIIGIPYFISPNAPNKSAPLVGKKSKTWGNKKFLQKTKNIFPFFFFC